MRESRGNQRARSEAKMRDDKLPWAKWFWGDWLSSLDLRQCSPAARGIWMDMLCVCAQSDPPGYLKVAGQVLDNAGIAKLCGITPEEAERLVAELEKHEVFSRNRDKTIYSRRLVRQHRRHLRGVENGRKGGNPKYRKDTGKSQGVGTGDNPPDNPGTNQAADPPANRSANTQRLEARGQRLEESQNPSAESSSVAARARSKMSEDDLWHKLVHDLNELWEQLNNPYPFAPIAIVETWREKGYDREMILRVARKKFRKDYRSLSWLDRDLEREYPNWVTAGSKAVSVGKPVVNAEPVIGWDKAVGTHKSSHGAAWISAWGPAPCENGCKAPRDVLTKYYPEQYPSLHQGGNA